MISKFQHDLMLRAVKFLDVILMTLPFAACWFLYYGQRIQTPLDAAGHVAVLALYAVLFIVLGKVYDAFLMSMQRVSELAYSQILAAMAADGLLYIVICLLSAKLCNLLPGIAAIAGQLAVAALWSAAAHRWYYAVFPPQPTAVIYDTRHGMEKLIREYDLNLKYDVRMTLSVQECLRDLRLLDDMKTVFLSGIHSHDRNIILKYCVVTHRRRDHERRTAHAYVPPAHAAGGTLHGQPRVSVCQANDGHCAVPGRAGGDKPHLPGDGDCHQAGRRAGVLQTGAPDQRRACV